MPKRNYNEGQVVLSRHNQNLKAKFRPPLSSVYILNVTEGYPYIIQNIDMRAGKIYSITYDQATFGDNPTTAVENFEEFYQLKAEKVGYTVTKALTSTKQIV